MRRVKPTVPEKTLTHLEWHRVRERLAHHCRGPLAHARALALDFADDAAELDRRQRLVAEARRLFDTGRSPPLGEVPDVRAVAGLAARGGVLEPDALAAVGVVLEIASRCSRYLDDLRDEAPSLAAEGDALPRRVDLARALLEAIDERGQLADGASGDLGHLRLRVAHLHVQLKARIDGLVSDPEVGPMLQDDYYTIREDRYVLPVRSGHKNHVPGIVHGWSQTAQTVFIEPQAVVEANNALRFAQADVEREVQRILTRLSARVGEAADDIVRAVEHLATLDLALAAAALSGEMDATAPIITDDATLALRRARHPLLVLEGVPVVPNDLQLGGGQRALVITGPNTGGKTVALKTAGLCVVMALCGLHVPCAFDSVVPRVPGLFTDIGDEQSLSAHLSTFSGHVANLRAILDVLLPGGLVLLDELVVGTDPVQGSALAQAIAEALVARGALAIITTHYEGLKALPFSDPRFRNGAMGIDGEGRLPTYRLRLDVPGTSSALVTARRLGLDPEIVDRAETLAGAQHRSLEAVLSRLERDAEAARQAKEALEADRRAGEKARRTAEDLERMWRERLKAGLQKERSAALTEARRLRDEIRRLKAQLEEPEMRKDVQKLAEQKSRAEKIIERVVAQEDAARAAQAGPAVPPSALTPGLKVYVVSLGCEGVVERAPDARGKVDVRAGLLAMKLDAGDLRLASDKPRPPGPPGAAAPRAPATPTPSPALRVSPGTWAEVTPQAPHNTVDVRGMRTHEAIAVTERFLDAQMEKEANAAYVIHGHGTGALKKELRQWLRTSGYARDFRPGEPHQGGDGVTAVLLA
jgi:DNA mismatch repair protein MutS2